MARKPNRSVRTRSRSRRRDARRIDVLIHPIYIGAAASFVAIAAVADGFTGDYSAKTGSGTLALTLVQDGDAVTGTFSDGSTKMGLRGTVASEGKQASGKLSLGGQELPITFTLRRDGDKIRFAMNVAGEEETFLFAPSGGTKPKPAAPSQPSSLAKPAKPVTPAKPAPTPVKGGVYRHPAGFRLPLVEGWRVLPLAGASCRWRAGLHYSRREQPPRLPTKGIC